MGSSASAPIGTFWIKMNFFGNSPSLVVPRPGHKVWANLGPNGPNLGRIWAKKLHFQGFWPIFLPIFGFFQIWPKQMLVGQQFAARLANFWPIFFFFIFFHFCPWQCPKMVQIRILQHKLADLRLSKFSVVHPRNLPHAKFFGPKGPPAERWNIFGNPSNNP